MSFTLQKIIMSTATAFDCLGLCVSVVGGGGIVGGGEGKRRNRAER